MTVRSPIFGDVTKSALLVQTVHVIASLTIMIFLPLLVSNSFLLRLHLIVQIQNLVEKHYCYY